MGTNIRRIVSVVCWTVLVVFISAAIIFALDNEEWGLLTQILTMVVGILVGNLLMHGAYRRFGWGESAAKSIYRWGWVVGGIIVLLVLVVLGTVLGVRTSNEPLATIIFWTTFGVWIGFVSRAGAISKQ